jgi:hypothetical protein
LVMAHHPLHRLPGERANPARAPSKDTSTKQSAEEAWNSILEATAHHPNAGEDQAAKTDDRPRVDGERFERSHERRSA